MSRPDPCEDQLLEALRRSDEPTDEDVARVRAKLGVRIAAIAGAAGAVAAAAKAGGSPTSMASGAGQVVSSAGTVKGVIAWSGGALLWKSVPLVAIGGIAIAAGWAAHARREDPRSPLAAAPLATNPTPVPRGAVPSVAPSGGPVVGAPTASEPRHAADSMTIAHRDRTSPLAPDSSASSSAARFDGEITTLRRAQQSLSRGDARGALRWLDESRASYPGGIFADERTGMHAIALCEAGDLDQGRAEAEGFLATHPSSPLRVRVRASCGLARR